MSTIDILFLIIIVFFMILGLIRGFIKIVFGKLAIIGSIVCAVLFNNYLCNALESAISNSILRKISAFLIIFVAVFLVLSIIQHVLSNMFSGDILKGLDKALGLLAGTVEGIFIIAVIIMVLNLQTWFDVQAIFENSIFYSLLHGFVQVPVDYITSGVSS